MKNIVLIGLMGAGKTSVGKRLSDILNYDFIDTDARIESEEKLSINEIFSKFGEKKFRELENDMVLRISATNDTIISTGGGTVQNIDNFNKLNENSLTVYLKTTPGILYDRVKTQSSRPLLKNNNPVAILEKLMTEREENYNKSDYILDTSFKSVEEIAEEIIKVYNANCKCKN